ncbi:phosphonate transport system ATP-binding protein [Peptoclostridium litorale DSM 5388]|uniref:Phosphonates import ATP-binding protein PhnC n=1 Tax=Peptoclostridium litorale DSM 5388 TaxID=1121324 RepID=A0A069RHV6_PEPLI|nr:ATP-binding cassette domain-containing protein [Peptoclostridium litorale]KDR95730.1 phosphonates import ATP-binding protein PhnC [Peptoclostridium litorale DSM 5388]SIO22451.1 phosphonate transport system ATP-binding protein [Peptoclostridium litorale DSM 5388]
MSVKNIIELDNISKTFGEMEALSSISLNVKKGELIALIGPSGAGKTTLLNILSSIVKPDSGSVLVDGVSIASYKNNREFARKVGVIRQQFDLIPQLPVIHNVLVGNFSHWGTLKSLISLILPQDKKSAENALSRTGLIDKIYDRTSRLSGGEQQRVALARLLVQKPDIILADEPVSSLDPARAQDILSILSILVKEDGQTLVTTLHSVEYAKLYFDRIIGMRSGKLFFDKPAEYVTEKDLADLYTLKGDSKLHESDTKIS